MAKGEVVKKESTPATVYDESAYSAHAAAGFDEATEDVYSVARLYVLHQLSPQCNPSKPEYIQSAVQGKIMHSVTKELFDFVTLIPVYFRRTWLEWVPRDQGGGLVAEYGIRPANAQRGTDGKGPWELPNGNILNDTRSHYCLLMRGDSAEPVIVSMTSVQLKKSSDWMSMMKNRMAKDKEGNFFQLPMFSASYEVTTRPESNDKGDWAGWVISSPTPLMPSGPIYDSALAFVEMCRADRVKADVMPDESGSDDIPVGDDEAPF